MGGLAAGIPVRGVLCPVCLACARVSWMARGHTLLRGPGLTCVSSGPSLRCRVCLYAESSDAPAPRWRDWARAVDRLRMVACFHPGPYVRACAREKAAKAWARHVSDMSRLGKTVGLVPTEEAGVFRGRGLTRKPS